MIDRSTLVWLGLVIAIGFVLFHIKERVQELEEHLSGLHDRITDDRDEIHALRAEWSYLNDPVRIEELARRHLPFQPVDARQVQALDRVPMRGGVAGNGATAGLAPSEGTVMVTEPLPASVPPPQPPVRSVMVPVPADGPVGGIGHLPEIVRATRSLLVDPARVPPARVPSARVPPARMPPARAPSTVQQVPTAARPVTGQPVAPRQASPAVVRAAPSHAAPSHAAPPRPTMPARLPASGTLRPEDMVPSTLSPPRPVPVRGELPRMPRPVPQQTGRPALPTPVRPVPVQQDPAQQDPVQQDPAQQDPVQPAPSLDRPPPGHAIRTRTVAIGSVTDAGMLRLVTSRPTAPTR